MDLQENDQVNQWRQEAGEANPAGPLYSSGKFAEADIASVAEPCTLPSTGGHCSICTGSGRIACC
jgi:hypothetical protein